MAVVAVDQTKPVDVATWDTVSMRNWGAAERIVCAAVVGSLGLRLYLPSQTPVGLVLMLATLPAWLGVLRRFRYALALWIITLAAGLAGIGLTIYALNSHYVARWSLTSDLNLALFTFGGVGVVLWGRQRLGSRNTALIAGFGMLVGSALHGYSPTMNAWKGSWAIPVTIVVLSFASRSRWLSMAGLLVLATTSMVFDTRAHAAVLIICVLLVAWQLRPLTPSRRVSYLSAGILLIGLALVGYHFGTEALVQGYLGTEAQARSVEQIDSSGSLILSGRPEIAATAALMVHRFWGYGFGVMPRTSDVLAAKEGLARINYDPNNGYVDRYMFGTGFELHSIVGDVWVRMGPCGLLLLGFVVVILVRSLADRLRSRSATGLVLFLTLWTFWNVFLSPHHSAALPMTLAVGLAIPSRTAVHESETSARRD